MNAVRHPMERFEERLLTALKQVVAERGALVPTPAPGEAARPARRSGWKPGILVAGAVALGLTVTGIVAVGPAGTPAYAVTSQGDGRVRVEINHLSDADGLERKLEQAGIPAAVDYLATGMSCKEPRFTAVPGDPRDMIGFEGGADGSLAFTLDRADFEGDRTLVVVTSGPKEGPPTGADVMAVIARGTVGPCEPVDAASGTHTHPAEDPAVHDS
ncbi:MAG: hypothetical protein ABR575_06055 [Actinomycetota bacterium]